MAVKRTLDFLPSIFQTDTNRKFLSATLDQLVSEPEYTRLNGFAGRKFAPTYKTSDSYVPEVDVSRQNYQLEPSLVVKNSSNEIDFYSSYMDLINKISYYGGATGNHDRLFASEYYTYTGLIDADKFINYQQYYWIPNGPMPVQIPSQFVTKQATYTFAKDEDDRCYRIDSRDGDNPELLLVRGGYYKFKVNQPGSKFYIQTEPGISGNKRVLPNVSSRDIYGVVNNGTDNGFIEFAVPLIDSQDVYLKMPMQSPVDFAVSIPFTEVDGKLWEDIVANYNGFDGIDIVPDSKFIVFINSSTNEADWTRADGSIVNEQHRHGQWRVRLTKNVDNKDVVNLDYIKDLANGTRIYSRLGLVNANHELYKNAQGQFLPVPALTAQLDTLYYQDATNPNMHGKIRIVNTATDNIYVDTSIIGKKNYTSPGGVTFTNGLLVQFDSNVEPAKYANNKYIVEGVGRGIRLVDFQTLVSPEDNVTIETVAFDTDSFSTVSLEDPYLGPTTPEYITMNRGTLDLNAWARHNRWFHVDVLIKAAEYNGTSATFDQAVRAQRPIIEFEPDLQLLNNGRIGKRPVNHIDTVTTDAFNQVQHSRELIVNGSEFKQGQRVLFANDKDPLVKTQVYKIQYSIQSEPSSIETFDGTGTGTIDIDRLNLNYETTNSPILAAIEGGSTYRYSWTVTGNKSLLNAEIIDGLNWPELTRRGYVQMVNNLGSNQYELIFATDFEIVDFTNSQVEIKSSDGVVTVTGVDTRFQEELEVGAGLYDRNENYLGTIVGIMSNNKLQLEAPATEPLENSIFWYRNPRIQLLISDDPTDTIEENDCLVATTGLNKGNTFWFNGTNWVLGQAKTKTNQPPLFDAFDDNGVSFSAYKGSTFAGTKIFSYKDGVGTADSVLGFPISYTNVGNVTNTSIADITFNNNFGSDTFKYLVGTAFQSIDVDSGYLRQNTNRTEFVKRNGWSTVNESSRQYQIISKTYTGKTNYFEIDVAPDTIVETPTIKVLLNNVLLRADQYTPNAKFGKRTAVRIPASLLTVGDKVDILIYSRATSKIGYYQIPTNLDFNSKNERFSTITLGQMRNNLVQVGQNIPEVVGNIPGDSNLRDLDSRTYGGNVLQNSSPVIYGGLFLIDQQANFISGIDHARREYTKFKNKFLELCMTLKGLDIHDPQAGVDAILLAINSVKNKTFPWYYSDMVPYGEAEVITYSVLDTNQRQYKIDKIFNDTVLQNRAVLVYHNGQQLIKGKDFTFDQTKPAIQLSADRITLIGDTLEIKDYTNTDANFIPETPTKLGLYPKFLPSISLDTSYRTPTEVIYGHDGSVTPAFGDFRDNYLLELELRIYNNIKVDPNKTILDIRTFIPGRFRTTDYSLNEYNKILNSSFMKWAGANKVDFNSNEYFESNDPFSYNYSYSKDNLFNEFLPGYWRGIYQYFYDTERPHSHPWEMLGFAEEPVWWQDEYGPAPYTSTNTILWDDLEAGVIRQGDNAGQHAQYTRVGLSKVIPVDASGNLVSPLDRIAGQFNSQYAAESFKVGDVGPAEAAWRRTSEYPYSLQIVAGLMKPAIYFGTLIDTNNYFKNAEYNQYIDVRTKRRITPSSVAINSEVVGNSITRGSGYVNWIVDYLTSLGINGATKVRGMLDALQVQLSYKVAGYTDKKYLTILAEQYSPTSTNDSVIIPDDSYSIYLNKSVPVERIAYSAVIIEKTDTGFAVSGYNTGNPYFTVVPSETTGKNYSIDVDGTKVTIYKDYKRQKLTIPYGTEFKNRQQVVDFLISYQRYLFAQGFVFDKYNEDLAKVQDWVLSCREFIVWTMQGWRPGNVIILSPIGDVLKVNTNKTVVDQIVNSTSGSRLLDPNFNVIKTTDITVMRDNGQFKVSTIDNRNIAFAELNLVQYEHVLVFDNATVFNDIIYKPESGSRQYRLKLVGNKTANWDGSLNPAGFVYNNSSVDSWKAGKDYLKGDIVSYKGQYYVATKKVVASTTFNVNSWKQIEKDSVKTGLLPNFSNNAGRFVDVYDIDSSLLDSQMAKMSNGLIGYRPRAYLNDLNVNGVSQAKFYQGYIKEKGTGSAITNLLNATFNDLSNDVDYFEEWAVRVGEYGATESNRYVEVVLDEALNKNNPTGISIIANGTTGPNGIVNVEDQHLWDRPFSKDPVKFITRNDAETENDIQFAGYVNIDDVDATLFDGSNYQALDNEITDIGSGYLVWVAKDRNRDWNVYRATETDNSVVSITYGLDTVGKVTTLNPHTLKAGQALIIKNFNSSFNGFYTVVDVSDNHAFTVTLSEDQVALIRSKPITGTGVLFTLNSVRFKEPSEIAGFTPRHGWKDGDLVWADRDELNNWAVYEKNSVWNYSNNLDIRLGSYRSDMHYGTSIKINNNNKFVVVGAPGDQEGQGRIHVFFKEGNRERGILRGGLVDINALGQSVDMTQNIIVAGAPDSYNTAGAVVIYRYRQNTFFTPIQIINAPEKTLGAKFGYSVSISEDSKHLYVGSPGNGTVNYYRLKEYEDKITTFDVVSARNGCVMPYTVNDIDSLAVYLRGKLLVKGRDFSWDPARNKLTFLLQDFPDLLAETGYQFVTEDGMNSLIGEFGLGVPGAITVVQRSYYEFKVEINAGLPYDEFGYSIRTTTDGSQVLIGAPGTTVDGVIRAGRGYVYAKSSNDAGFTTMSTLVGTNPVYRGHFGNSVDICPNSCSLYVGEPGYSDLEYSGGQVHRYVNAGKLFGSLLGTTVNPTVSVGSSIIINGATVTFTGTTLSSVVADINAANIVGVRASVSNNQLLLTSISETAFDKLNVAPGNGTAFSALGFVVFETAQSMKKPFGTQGDNFGEVVKIGNDAESLAVASTVGTVQTYSSLDDNTTTFDGKATQLMDIEVGTGEVYMHNFMPNSPMSDNRFGMFVFSEAFSAPNLHMDDKFGCGIDFNDNNLYIGASYNDTKAHNAGNAYMYTNPKGIKGWNKIRAFEPEIDVTAINGISLYNKRTKSKIATLDFIDPIKGKSLGVVEQSLDYKSSRDPAMYNAGTLVENSGSIDFHWGAQQVGQTWWNLDTARFVHYEQDSLVYRMNNWARLFPGSSVQVYEWVESNYKPSEYVGAGENGNPLHADDSYYVQISYADGDTGVIKTKYYFWVRGLTTSSGTGKPMSIMAVEDAIEDPKKQNIPYAAILDNHSFALFNCDQFITGTDVIVKVDYDHVINNNMIHSEFDLVREGDVTSVMPTRIVNKLIDSLAGIDYDFKRVPDAKLRPSQANGLEIRPRQTLVNNRHAALKNVVQFVNEVFAQTTAAYKLQNSSKFNTAFFFGADQEPDKSEYDYRAEDILERSYVNPIPGTKVLVANDAEHYGMWTLSEILNDGTFKLIKNQKYKTTDLWEYANWFKADYDTETKPTYTVAEYKDIEKLNPVAGDIVRVSSSSTGGYEIYRYTSSTTSELVAVENGTIKLKDIIWDTENNNIGFDNCTLEETGFDRDFGAELRQVLLGLEKDIFVDDLVENYNKFLFTVIKYILSEQQNVDWIFKTSFINVIHKIKELKSYPNYVKDNHDYYEEYINEVKPYRTKIREYRVGYTGMDYAYAATTDFDLPGYYDRDLGRFRSPSTESTKDGELFLLPEYKDWAQNFTSGVESILIADAGHGYTQAPTVQIVANGDGGTGATAIAIINEVTGKVSKILVTDPGKGYRNTPYVIINGDGADARGYAQLANKKIRSLKTTIKFDRVSYGTDVREWVAGVTYNAGDLVSYQGKSYRATVTSAESTFNPGHFVTVNSSTFDNANDRIASTYYPGTNQIPKEFDASGKIDLKRLVPGITYQYNVVSDDPSVYNETTAAGTAPASATPAQITVVGGTFFDLTKSYAPEEFVPGITYDSLIMRVETIDEALSQRYIYNILKDQNGVGSYFVVDPSKTTTLAADLNYNDNKVFLTNLNGISAPNALAGTPGMVNINGEIIKFWHVNVGLQCIVDPIRGTEGTGTPLVHPAGTVVEDISEQRRVPGTTTVTTDRFTYTAKDPIFRPGIFVNSDISVVNNLLEVWNGFTKLTLGVDYTLAISNYNNLYYNPVITFTNAANFADGINFEARYIEDRIWLNAGISTPADGTGLANSETTSAMYVKQYPHNLP